MTTKIRIGTRDSKLAMWQANYAKKKLKDSGVNCEIIKIKSEGDINQITPLYDFGVSGIFTKNLDQALLNNRIDIAVHSLKDVPINMASGLTIQCVFERADPNDIIIYKKKSVNLKKKLIIATSSIRRKTQWLKKYPRHQIVSLRGNVGTRIDKLKKNEWDGAIFAKAGLDRLSIDPEYSELIEWMIPSAAQGVVGVATRSNDLMINKLLESVNCKKTHWCVSQERKFLKLMNGGCSVPISAYAFFNNDKLHFKVNITSLNSKKSATVFQEYGKSDEYAFEKIYSQLMLQGGKEILDELKKER
jgi:hydroxymethylbilane synthase